ncbi:MAG: sn-glycerol-3-phosphate ABC transporter ATP-binding protein UgpC [Actinobacteria bacterium]|nr:sn-glycerol-3-phosphate ABC transporter ATP-binding protein UgpC [Cyanobacteriota bacterium]MCL6087641.1 sn-glycerol-3-phosphate ABC transporter ATP-binding protein UgpC [Actinomycetota bacterium]
MARVVLKDLMKRFEDVIAVNEMNTVIEDQEFVVLVGPSGCGKTTTLRMIAGLEEITKGEIYIGDRKVNDVPPKDRDIAMVFQNYALYPHMNVYDNMAFGLKLRRTPKCEIEKRVNEAAKILSIQELLKRRPKQLSGGQRQRVALGRAIVRNPKVFLMDEPLSNLDAKLRVQMRTEIAKLHKRLNATIVYVTHDQTEAMTMADRMIIMKNGLVQQIGKPQEVYDHPLNIFVAGFIGSPAMNFLDVTVTDKYTLKNKTFELETPEKIRKVINDNNLIGKEVILGIRPEHLEDSAFVQGANPLNTITANVEVTEPMGAEIYAYIDIEGVLMTARVNPRSKAKFGESLTLFVDLDTIHLFNKDTEQAYI